MNVNKPMAMLLLFFTFFSFSQKKEDVYFKLNDKSNKYVISHLMHGKEIGMIILSDKKEYEYHQKKVKEAKEKGDYEFDPESGRDNLKIKVSKLTFEVLSKKKIKLNDCGLHKLKLVDYDWLKTESWKQINGKELSTGKPLSFKDIYFLYKTDENKHVSYKVGVTTVAY